MDNGQGFYGSIELEELFAGLVVRGNNGKDYVCLNDLLARLPVNVGQKNGKHYLSIGMWLNDGVDQYGNVASITLGQTKDEIAQRAKRRYIGNLRRSAPAQAVPPPQNTGYQQPQQASGYGQQYGPQQHGAPTPNITADDLPF